MTGRTAMACPANRALAARAFPPLPVLPTAKRDHGRALALTPARIAASITIARVA